MISRTISPMRSLQPSPSGPTAGCLPGDVSYALNAFQPIDSSNNDSSNNNVYNEMSTLFKIRLRGNSHNSNLTTYLRGLLQQYPSYFHAMTQLVQAIDFVLNEDVHRAIGQFDQAISTMQRVGLDPDRVLFGDLWGVLLQEARDIQDCFANVLANVSLVKVVGREATYQNHYTVCDRSSDNLVIRTIKQDRPLNPRNAGTKGIIRMVTYRQGSSWARTWDYIVKSVYFGNARSRFSKKTGRDISRGSLTGVFNEYHTKFLNSPYINRAIGLQISGQKGKILFPKGSIVQAREMTREQLIKVTNDVLSACETLHGSNLAHGDIKFENIVKNASDYQLIDFEGVSSLKSKNDVSTFAAYPKITDKYTKESHDLFSIGLLWIDWISHQTKVGTPDHTLSERVLNAASLHERFRKGIHYTFADSALKTQVSELLNRHNVPPCVADALFLKSGLTASTFKSSLDADTQSVASTRSGSPVNSGLPLWDPSVPSQPVVYSAPSAPSYTQPAPSAPFYTQPAPPAPSYTQPAPSAPFYLLDPQPVASYSQLISYPQPFVSYPRPVVYSVPSAPFYHQLGASSTQPVASSVPAWGGHFQVASSYLQQGVYAAPLASSYLQQGVYAAPLASSYLQQGVYTAPSASSYLQSAAFYTQPVSYMQQGNIPYYPQWRVLP